MLPIVTMFAARDPESIANREFMEKLADQQGTGKNRSA